jgi:hypothetical protein
VQAWREDHDEEDADPMQGDDSPAAVRLHAERHGTRSARAGEPRSTTERACFTTCLEATPTCAAREVTLYLAVASPSSSTLLFRVSPPYSSGLRRLTLPGRVAELIGDPSPDLFWVRRRHAWKSRSMSKTCCRNCTTKGHSSIVRPVVSRS